LDKTPPKVHFFSYNTTIHSAHGKTPREVFFGHKLFGIYRALHPNEPPPEVVVHDDNEEQDAEETTVEHTVEDHLNQVTRIQDAAKERLEKSRNYMVKHGSVHRRKTLFKAGQAVIVAPDTDMNPATRKRKLQPNFKDMATVVRMSNNNHTVVVRFEDGREMGVPVKRTRVLNSRSEDQFSSSSTDVNLTNKIDS